MNILIIGQDSFLAKNVSFQLELEGHSLFGTSRRSCYRHGKKSSRCKYFDLSEHMSAFPTWTVEFDVAFLAASMTNIQACEDNPRQAYFINVKQTSALIEMLMGRGVHVVFPSTNLVLACDKPFQKPEAPRKPKSVYAASKTEIESQFLGNPLFSVARLPKILDISYGIMKLWMEKLHRGEPIQAFNNMTVAPVSLDYAAIFLVLLMSKKIPGLWQISGTEEVTYYELAKQMVKLLGFDESLVLGSEAPDVLASLTVHPSLCCEKSRKILSCPGQDLEDVLARAFNFNNVSSQSLPDFS